MIGNILSPFSRGQRPAARSRQGIEQGIHPDIFSQLPTNTFPRPERQALRLATVLFQHPRYGLPGKELDPAEVDALPSEVGSTGRHSMNILPLT